MIFDVTGVEPGFRNHLRALDLGVDFNEPRLVDRSVGKAEPELTDEGWFVEMGAGSPRQCVLRHFRDHARPVVDERHGADGFRALMSL